MVGSVSSAELLLQQAPEVTTDGHSPGRVRLWEQVLAGDADSFVLLGSVVAVELEITEVSTAVELERICRALLRSKRRYTALLLMCCQL